MDSDRWLIFVFLYFFCVAFSSFWPNRIFSILSSLPKIGRSGSGREESSSPSESTFDDNAHLSQYTERFIFEDDHDNNNSSRLSSLQMNRVLHDDGIWKDKQGLGVGPSALGSSSSYLQRYLMGNDDDSFPTMVSVHFPLIRMHAPPTVLPLDCAALAPSAIIHSGMKFMRC